MSARSVSRIKLTLTVSPWFLPRGLLDIVADTKPMLAAVGSQRSGVVHSVVEPRFHWHSCTYTEHVDRAERERYVGPRAVRAFDDGVEDNRSGIAILHHGFSMTTQAGPSLV